MVILFTRWDLVDLTSDTKLVRFGIKISLVQRNSDEI